MCRLSMENCLFDLAKFIDYCTNSYWQGIFTEKDGVGITKMVSDDIFYFLFVIFHVFLCLEKEDEINLIIPIVDLIR